MVCKVRKRRFANGCCKKCNARVIAEGTYGLYGVAKEPEQVTAFRKQMQAYNRLIEKGMSQGQIAQKWNMKQSTLASKIHRARKAGIKMYSHPSAVVPNVKTAKIRKKINDHGGGKYGITGCKCDLCVVRRREAKNAYNAARRAQQQKKLQELESAWAERTQNEVTPP